MAFSRRVRGGGGAPAKLLRVQIRVDIKPSGFADAIKERYEASFGSCPASTRLLSWLYCRLYRRCWQAILNHPQLLGDPVIPVIAGGGPSSLPLAAGSMRLTLALLMLAVAAQAVHLDFRKGMAGWVHSSDSKYSGKFEIASPEHLSQKSLKVRFSSGSVRLSGRACAACLIGEQSAAFETAARSCSALSAACPCACRLASVRCASRR